MESIAEPVGRRQRGKQDKLERIRVAAQTLLSRRSLDDVTTQEVAQLADIGAGTLFLYVQTKAELLLLVQNSLYAEAVEQGRIAAAGHRDVVDAVVAFVAPTVRCNRAQVDNGRTYLKEMVFGDPTEPRHREALDIVGRAEVEITRIVRRTTTRTTAEATNLGGVVSAVLLSAMAPPMSDAGSGPDSDPVAAVLSSVRDHLDAVFAADRIR